MAVIALQLRQRSAARQAQSGGPDNSALVGSYSLFRALVTHVHTRHTGKTHADNKKVFPAFFIRKEKPRLGRNQIAADLGSPTTSPGPQCPSAAVNSAAKPRLPDHERRTAAHTRRHPPPASHADPNLLALTRAGGRRRRSMINPLNWRTNRRNRRADSESRRFAGQDHHSAPHRQSENRNTRPCILPPFPTLA